MFGSSGPSDKLMTPLNVPAASDSFAVSLPFVSLSAPREPPRCSGIDTTSGSRPSAFAFASSLCATASITMREPAWRARERSFTRTGMKPADTLTGIGFVVASVSLAIGTAVRTSR